MGAAGRVARQCPHGGRFVDHDLEMDFAALVRSSLEAGASPDHVAKSLIADHHLLPISAIKALRSGGEMTSAEAKELVRRNLPGEQWAAAERLWDMIAPEATTGDGDTTES